MTLDLNGFVVRGGYVCNTTPPNCPALTGDGIHLGAGGVLTVRNGTITDIGHTGILLDSSSTATIEGVNVEFVGARGIDSSGGHVTVRQSVINGTQGDGIHALAAKVLDTRVLATRGDAIDIIDRGWVWGVETSNSFMASLRLNVTLGGYAMCRLDRTPSGGLNLGQNLCADKSSGLCP